MNISTILPLLSFIFVVFLGIFVYRKNPKLPINIIFFWLSMCVSIWLFGTFMMFLNKNNDQVAVFWDRFIYIGVVFVPVVFYHFSLAFNKLQKNKVLLLGYFLSLIFLILSRTKYFVDGIFKYRWGVHTEARFFHHLYLIYFTIYLSLFFYNFYRAYKNSRGITREQIKYILIAFFILIIVGSAAFLPAYKIAVYPFSYLAGAIFTAVVAYAIIRYRLMDIRLVVRQITVYGTSLIISGGICFLIMLFTNNYTSSFIPTSISGLIILIFGIIIFQFVKDRFGRFANKHLFYTLYSYEKTLGDLSQKLSSFIDLDKLTFVTTNTIKDVMKLDKITLILKRLPLPKGQSKLLERKIDNQETELEKNELNEAGEKFYLAKNIGFEEKETAILTDNQFLIHYLEEIKEVLVYDELDQLIEKNKEKIIKNKFSTLKKYMDEMGTELYLPLFIEDRLIGVFILGKKVSGDIYSAQDINLLKTLANQVAIAINNAQLYEQSQYFNQILKSRIVEATKELSRAYADLKKLDDSKTEFLSLASHQLRTPLSAIKGYLSMVMEGNFGTLEKETKEAVQSVYDSNERLINLVNDLLNITRIEAGKLEYRPVKNDLQKLIREVIGELKINAEKKNLELEYLEKKLPEFSFDPDKIRQVLVNFIDNAIKYTGKGKVCIKTIKRNNEITVECADTGIGIAPEKMSSLFQWFSRGKGAFKLDAGGFGLGLYIAKKIVEKAGGKIGATSKGDNQGSTFYFSLPIDK